VKIYFRSNPRWRTAPELDLKNYLNRNKNRLFDLVHIWYRVWSRHSRYKVARLLWHAVYTPLWYRCIALNMCIYRNCMQQKLQISNLMTWKFLLSFTQHYINGYWSTRSHVGPKLFNTRTWHFWANVCFALLLVVNQWKVKVENHRNAKKRMSKCYQPAKLVLPKPVLTQTLNWSKLTSDVGRQIGRMVSVKMMELASFSNATSPMIYSEL